MARTMERPSVEAQQDQPKGATRRRWPRLALLAAVILAVAAAGYWLLAGSGDEADEEAPPEDGPVVQLTDLTANVGGDGFHYVRVSMAAVLRAGTDIGPVEHRFPVLKDAALSELARMSADELRTAEGLDTLRSRLTDRAHDVYPEGEVLRILITELVVQ